MNTFAQRLVAAVASAGPLCAGIDPSAALLESWGLPDDPSGLDAFCERCVEAFAGVIPAIKPQVAFFERHGASGLGALERLIASARAAGLLCICDAKRGDMDSTMAAYAEAWAADTSALAADAVTATPFLGLGSLEPLLEVAGQNGRGVFVVVRSSNPEGRGIQEAVMSDGQSVEDSLLRALAGRNGEGSLGSIGAVIGATLAPSGFELSQFNGPFLAPGVGFQGGGAAEVARLFKGCAAGSVLPSASRSLLSLGPSVDALASGAEALRDEFAAALA